MKKLACIVALSGAFLSLDAMAWGNEGHRVVGSIADQLLKGSKAEQAVRELLLPGESLEKVANWADCVKGTYCGPQTEEMVAFTTAHPKHTEYHYTDVPFQLSEYRDGAVGTAHNDIVQTLKASIATLQGKGDGKLTKRQALLLIAHLAGDIHQPLHVGAAFVDKDGAYVVPQTHAEVVTVNVFDSRGGNNLLIDDDKLSAISAAHNLSEPRAPDSAKPGAGAPKANTRTFHSYWDSTAVRYAMRRLDTREPDQFARKVIDARTGFAHNSGDPVTWPYQWANDALTQAKLAHTGVTAGLRSTQTSRSGGATYFVWALQVPDSYPVASSELAKQQLIKGGYQLAALLKAIWPE